MATGSKRKYGWEGGVRSFASGNGCRWGRNFFVEPDVTDLVRKLEQGRYVLLTGARQTGKTTTVFYAADALKKGYCCIYVDFPAHCVQATSLEHFWKILSSRVHVASQGVLPPPTLTGDDAESYFRSMFLSGKGREDVILVFDEANHFCRLDDVYKESFISNLRHLKQLQDSRLLSILLVGTDSLLEYLHVQNRYREYCGLDPSGDSSPFSNDDLLVPRNFTLGNVEELLKQYQDFSGVEVEDGIAAHINQLTRGHKGLVGVCCSLLAEDMDMGESSQRTLAKWERFAKRSLTQKVFLRPTYQRMWNNCRALGPSVQWILLDMLTHGGHALARWVGKEVVDTIEFLVAEGIVVDTSTRKNTSKLEFSSTLLHTCLLQQVVHGGQVGVDPGPEPFSRMWVVERTIELLDMTVLLQPQSMNADGYTSEYGLQFEFFLKLSAVLKEAYPVTEWIEAKCEVNWRRRLDLLVRDGLSRWFGFEILRQGTASSMLEHYQRMLSGEGTEFKRDEGASVTVYNVFLDDEHLEARLCGSWAGDAAYEERQVKLRAVSSNISLEQPRINRELRLRK